MLRRWTLKDSFVPTTMYDDLACESIAIEPFKKPIKSPPNIKDTVSLTLSVQWGRQNQASWLKSVASLGMMTVAPTLVILWWIALEYFGGSLSQTFSTLTAEGPSSFAEKYAPRVQPVAILGYIAWVILQGGLYTVLPGNYKKGQPTPAGNELDYNCNGLYAWIISVTSAVVLVQAGIVDGAIIAKNWESLVVITNVYGLALTMFAYLKAQLLPSHPADRKYTG